jgi:GT2 family glycosyltransferase
MVLSVIIVSFETEMLLRECLRSLRSATLGVSHEIIVVDNASGDASCAMVEREFPECSLIRNQQNRRFAGANNQGLAVARGRFVLFLNSDTIVPPGQIEKLVGFLEVHPAAGAVGPREYDFEKNFASEGFAAPGIWERCCENFHLVRWPMPLALKRALCPRGIRGLDRGVTREVGWISGACMLVRRETVEVAGGFNEQIGFYGEEVEWCWRATHKGYAIWVLPEARVLHKGRGSVAGKADLDVNAPQFRLDSYVALQRLTVGIPRSVVMSLIVTASAFLKMLVCFVGSRPQWRTHKAAVSWELRVIRHLCAC